MTLLLCIYTQTHSLFCIGTCQLVHAWYSIQTPRTAHCSKLKYTDLYFTAECKWRKLCAHSNKSNNTSCSFFCGIFKQHNEHSLHLGSIQIWQRFCLQSQIAVQTTKHMSVANHFQWHLTTVRFCHHYRINCAEIQSNHNAQSFSPKERFSGTKTALRFRCHWK